MQIESKIPILKISVWGGVYHLNNRPNLPKEPRATLTSSKWLLKLLYSTRLMLQFTRNYFSQLLDYEEDGEFHLLSATAAFMKRDLKRIAGFCEVVVPSYAIAEFR